MHNDVYYTGSGPTIYAGTYNDITVQNQGLTGLSSNNPHMASGFAGGRRVGSRMAATIYGGMTSLANASPPSDDRVKADAAGCDSSALSAPCFDVGTTYHATATATWSGSTVTVTGGLSAHARPFVIGQAIGCTSCNSNLVITSLSVPPTQSTVSGAGEVGHTFTFTANSTIGGSGSGTITGSCSGTSGTGSNCIDIAFSINTTAGTFGTTSALATCGANNLNGNAPNYQPPAGTCSDNGIGEIVRAFRIGTNQNMYGNANVYPTGNVFDDGVDFFSGNFNQSAAFTCNLVAAKVVQCVKGPVYSSGVYSSVGQWSSGSTFITYGDMSLVSGRDGGLLGYVGGQSFPFTAGSGYTPNSTLTETASCSTTSGTFSSPTFNVTVSGGAIVNVQPAGTGYGIGGVVPGTACTVPLTGFSGGSSGAVTAINLAPVEGVGGIGTFNTDNNTMGMFLYDNTGFVGNPLNSFFTNGQSGYFEPGLPVRPFGQFMGAAVSG